MLSEVKRLGEKSSRGAEGRRLVGMGDLQRRWREALKEGFEKALTTGAGAGAGTGTGTGAGAGAGLKPSATARSVAYQAFALFCLIL